MVFGQCAPTVLGVAGLCFSFLFVLSSCFHLNRPPTILFPRRAPTASCAAVRAFATGTNQHRTPIPCPFCCNLIAMVASAAMAAPSSTPTDPRNLSYGITSLAESAGCETTCPIATRPQRLQRRAVPHGLRGRGVHRLGAGGRLRLFVGDRRAERTRRPLPRFQLGGSIP